MLDALDYSGKITNDLVSDGAQVRICGGLCRSMLLSWSISGGQAGAGLTCIGEGQYPPIWNRGLKSGRKALQTAALTSLGLLDWGLIWSMPYKMGSAVLSLLQRNLDSWCVFSGFCMML